MILDQFLNESSLGYAEDVEATNEGFDFEFGGFERVIELAECDTHKLNMAMMASEVQSVLALNENNQAAFEQIQEASIKGFFEKIREILKKLWARMKEVLNTVIMYFDKLVSDKKFVDRANKALANITSFAGLEFEGYEYTLNNVDPGQMYKKMIAKLKSTTSSGMGKQDEKELETAAKEIKSIDFKNQLIDIALKGATDADFESKITKALRNNADSKKKIAFDKATCTNAITGFKAAKSQLDNVKKVINESHAQSLKEVSDYEKNFKEGAAEGNKKYIAEIAKSSASLCTYIQNKANKAVSLKISALKEEKNQQKNIIMKAISVGNKNKRQNNSVISDDDYISNLMNQF